MATTLDAIVDRVRSLCVAQPFGLIESERWESFEAQPETNIDGVFRIPPPSSQWVFGEFDYVEDRVDTLQLWIARKQTEDPAVVRRLLLRDVHSLTAAIVRDGAQVSGEYAVLDDGRGHSVNDDDLSGKTYAVLRLSLPINYEVQL